jgi:hypothetical protein
LGQAEDEKEMIAELGASILELCIALPGAFLLASIKGKPKNTGQMMNDQYALSIAVGVVFWTSLVALIKFIWT